MKMLSNAGLFALLHVAAYGQTCTPETQPAFANVLDTLFSFTGSCGADVFAGVATTAAPTPAPTTAAPTTPAPTTPAPTTPAPTTAAPTTAAPTPPPPTPPPPTPPPSTTCARQLCLAPTTVSMTTTNTTLFSSTTTNTTLPAAATAAPTMTTTNTTTLTTVTTTNTSTSSIPSTTTTNSTLGSSTSTNTSTTTTSVTTETTTNYTTTTTNTTLSGNSWTAAPTMTTTNTTTLTTVTTTNTTLITAAPTQTTTNVTTTAKITTVTTRDPCACYTTTAASGSRRLQPTKIPRRLQSTGCNTSCAAITGMGFASNHPCASPIEANMTAECNIMGANALFSTCMPSFTLKCPENNNAATTKAFVHSAGKPLKCKVCGAVVAGADSASAELGKYRTTLTFGNNVASNGFAEDMISGYAIHIVDVTGKVVADTGVKVKVAGSLSCCKPDQYIAYLEGEWPAGGAMFSVVPYLTMSSTSTVMLPMGTGMSAAFTDVGNVPTKEVVQDLSLKGMTPAGCDELKNDANSDDILVTAVAQAAAKNAAVTKDMFTVVNNSKVCRETDTAARRLEAVQRRLSTHQLDFQIKAVVPAAVTYDATTVDGTDLVTEVKKAAKAKSNIEPVIASAEVAAPVVGPVVGEPEAPVTGAAHPVAGSLLSSIIVIIAAFAGPGLLA